MRKMTTSSCYFYIASAIKGWDLLQSKYYGFFARRNLIISRPSNDYYLFLRFSKATKRAYPFFVRRGMSGCIDTMVCIYSIVPLEQISKNKGLPLISASTMELLYGQRARRQSQNSDLLFSQAEIVRLWQSSSEREFCLDNSALKLERDILWRLFLSQNNFIMGIQTITYIEILGTFRIYYIR